MRIGATLKVTMDTSLYDDAITDALQLLRLSAGEARRVVALLVEMERELRTELREGGLTRRREDDVRRLLAQARRVIERYYAAIQQELDYEGAANVAAGRARASLEKAAVVASLSVQLPQDHVLKALAQENLILGAPAQAWWKRQAEDTVFQFSAQVRQGVLQGEGVDRIVARVFGQPRKGVPGVMDVSRRNAEALVRTSISSVSNSARLATFEANDDLVKGWRWVTALDGRVCLKCAAMADKAWTLDGKPMGHSTPLIARPPIHYNDRCTMVPVLRTWAELGVRNPPPEFDGGTRASATGQQPAGTTLAGYLTRNRSTAEDVLGPNRLRMWESGQITLADLVAGNGRELTLAQLKAL